MKKLFTAILFAMTCALHAAAGPAPGSIDVQWNVGAADCDASAQDPLQVHAYNSTTFILRQNLCVSFEANFLYLLIGAERALLIDSGAVEDPGQMPLARTVLELLPHNDGEVMPLTVVHTHGHRDHRAGDVQFASIPSAQVVPAELEDVQAFFGFNEWPDGSTHLDLGDRVVNVIAAPGHHPSHVVFHDEKTGLLFTGDFLLPGRLLVDDAESYYKSAVRIGDFLETRPVTHVLGGHIELDVDGQTYAHGSNFHPDERRLELSNEDLLFLSHALGNFNGFYAVHENFVITHPIRNLAALLLLAIVTLGFAVWGVRRLMRAS